ncbi:hypothetical protein [Streptomyces aureus]|uniref:hypothetical protein n=1 Tax=Streptomyces aureus TaxID=193461 RepID=UPI0036C5AFF7
MVIVTIGSPSGGSKIIVKFRVSRCSYLGGNCWVMRRVLFASTSMSFCSMVTLPLPPSGNSADTLCPTNPQADGVDRVIGVHVDAVLDAAPKVEAVELVLVTDRCVGGETGAGDLGAERRKSGRVAES